MHHKCGARPGGTPPENQQAFDYQALHQLARPLLYAATMTKAPLPKSEMRSSKLIDGVVWDGKNPVRYADRFKIKA